MKKLLIFLFMIISYASTAQTLSWETPTTIINGGKYTLIKIDDIGNATIKYERFNNDIVAEVGLYYNNTKTGIWHLYNDEGNLLSSMKFENNNRVWLKSYQLDRNLFITYKNNKVIEVTHTLLAQN